MSDQQNNPEKNRKSEDQKRFEEADNAGRFAGNDKDAQDARKQATATVRADDTRPRIDPDNILADEEAQNVTNGKDRISGEEAEKARNKATEGMRQNRDH